MKRTNDNESNFKVKPYISKKVRSNSQPQSEPWESEDVSIPRSNEVVGLTCRTSKCAIPKNETSRQRQHTNAVTSIQWNEIKYSCFASCSLDKSLLIWELASSGNINVVRKIQTHKEGMKDVKWMKGGQHLITASFDKTSQIIDAEKGVCLQSYEHNDLVTRVCGHPSDTNTFLSGTMDSGVFAWDIRQKKVIRRFKSHFNQVQDILFLDDCKTFLTSAEVLKKNSMDQTIMAWDYDTTAVLSNQIYQEPYACTLLKRHPKHKTILGQSSAGYIVIFDEASPWKMNKFKRYGGHTSAGYHIGFDISADGKYIYCGDNDGQLFIYDDFTSKILKKLHPFTSPLINVVCHPMHKSRIVMSSWNGEIALWE